MVKKILLGLLGLLLIIQFFPITKNQSDDELFSITKQYDVPENVASILKTACNDCHSNQTEYPWYSKIQPIAWWVANHVEDGKRHLNFSNFITRPMAVQYKKLDEIAKETQSKGMPIPSYTYLGLHSGANLTDEQRKIIVDWAKTQMDTLKARYPADSLVLKRKGPPPPQ